MAVAALSVSGLVTACTGSGSTGAAAPATSTSPATTTDVAAASPSASSTTTAAPAGVTLTAAGGTARTWTVAQLAALPTVTVTSAGGTPVSGVPLPQVAAAAGSTPSTAAAPFVTYDVTGPTGSVLLTRAESDPTIGDHPALLAVVKGRIDLVVPQDRTPARTLVGVTSVKVSTVSPAAAQPSPGAASIVVRDGGSSETVSLTALGPKDYTLKRPGGAVSQERGVRLTDVLTSAGVSVTSNQLITVSGPSGSAILTGGELISNVQEVGFSVRHDGRALSGPLFLISGDVSTARSVTDATTVTVTG